jgi:hypothetical protein
MRDVSNSPVVGMVTSVVADWLRDSARGLEPQTLIELAEGGRPPEPTHWPGRPSMLSMPQWKLSSPRHGHITENGAVYLRR